MERWREEATKWFPLRINRVRAIPLHVDMDEWAQRIELLKIEHRDLDDAIAALSEAALPNMMQIARLKKRKLALKDEIRWCENQIIPDIIA